MPERRGLSQSHKGMKPRFVEPVCVGSKILYTAREFASCFRHSVMRLSCRKMAQGIKRSNSRDPRLNYGWLEKRPSSGLPIGGEIKLIPLREKYPEQFDDFNLIYLVSSALPAHAEEIVAAAKAKGVRLVWNQNGIAYPGCYGDFYPWFNLRMATLRSQADYIVNQSEFSRISAERYLGHSAAPSGICFNPVDTTHFSPGERSLAEEPWRILAAGTSHAPYRTQSVLDTLRLLLARGRDVHLTIAGEFRWKGADHEVRQAMAGIEERVTILPPFRQDEAPDIYRRSHLLLHTKFNDPCPTVPIEAMSCGLPVVGTCSGGMPELVPKECGILVPVPQEWKKDVAGDPADLADAVECVMENHSAMSDAAREHAVDTFELRNWLDRHEQIFQQVIES